ncbi:hypothetical protein [Geotalea sp. SG265]|uniref:hypothetical protein n=1 Tax=Geotalea sp. SG265 TaxID=2922867 RepID=UPI001FAEBF89|nr:hypothetical protein [Geotalea sp. SG265]
MVAIKMFFLAMGAALSLVLTVPLHAAEVKVLDDLDKTVQTDAIKARCSRYQQALQALQKSLDDLNSGEEVSSIFRINKVLAQVAESEKLLTAANGELAALTAYVAVNREKLTAAGLEAFLPLAQLDDVSYRQYQEAVRAYLIAFKSLLYYSKSHISALRVGRKAEMDTHEKLYSEYVAATDRQGESFSEWSGFLFQFIQDNPALRPHLENNPRKEEKL